ncbi:ParB/RepB/Spo0J family partition protein [Candidatus Omnitrophota bacterium]
MKKVLGKGLSALVPDTYLNTIGEPAIETKVDSHSVTELPLAIIHPNPSQPRHHFSETALEELAQSIRENGIIQPIIVSKIQEDKYEIVCGERRYRAAQKAGLAKLPAIVKDIVGQNTLEIALIENIQREDLNPIEEAQAYLKLQEQGAYTQEEIAKKVGKDRTTIANALRLLKLPIDILGMVIGKKISEGHARALLAIPGEDLQRNMACRIIADSLSVRQTEQLIQKKAYKKRKAKEARRLDADIINLENVIQQKLGAPVRIFAGKKNSGRLEIKYKSLDELDRILENLGVYRG